MAGTIWIAIIRKTVIRFGDTRQMLLLKECLYEPKLGMNIMNLSLLDKEIHGLSGKKKLLLVNNKCLFIYTEALLYNGLY